MKVLKFIGAFLGFAAFIFLLVIGYNWKEFSTVFKNNPGLTEGSELIEKTFSLGGIADYIKENPQHVSVYSIPLRDSIPILALQESTPRTLGILGSTFIIVHYQFEKQNQRLTGKEWIPLDSVSAYQLPNIYRTAHEKSVNWLKEKQFVNNEKVQLEGLIQVLVQYNSLAIYDFLITYFGHANIIETAKTFGFTDELYLLPFSGLSIQFNPHVFVGGFEQRLDTLKKLSDLERAQIVFKSTHAYIHNPNFRDKVNTIFDEYESGLTFLQEKRSFDVYPKIKPNSLVHFIQSALSGSVLSKESKHELMQFLDWPMTDRTVAYHFNYYGGIFENRISIASGLDVAFAKERNDTLIQTVIFDQIPIALWLHMSSKYINLDYQRRIAWDPELRTRSTP